MDHLNMLFLFEHIQKVLVQNGNNFCKDFPYMTPLQPLGRCENSLAGKTSVECPNLRVMSLCGTSLQDLSAQLNSSMTSVPCHPPMAKILLPSLVRVVASLWDQYCKTFFPDMVAPRWLVQASRNLLPNVRRVERWKINLNLIYFLQSATVHRRARHTSNVVHKYGHIVEALMH